MTLKSVENRPEYNQPHSNLMLGGEDCFRGIFDGGLVAMAILLEDGTIARVNEAFCSFLGNECGELLGRRYYELVDPVNRESVAAYFRSVSIGNFTGHQQECQYTHKEGHNVCGLVAMTAIRNDDGDVQGIVVQAQNVTEERKVRKQLLFQASHDELTGLVNRREFQSRLSRVWHGTVDRGGQHVLCCIDLDQFKIVNDTYGHAVGDHMLKQIVTIMRGLFRDRDTLARIGGDEFGVIFENCTMADATSVCTTFINTLSNTNFVWNNRSFHIRASVGLVPIDSQSPDPVELLKRADLACYSAKDSGGSQMCTFTFDPTDPTKGSDIIRALQCIDALYDDRLRLFAQPIASLRDGEPAVHWYEVMLRVIVGESGFVSPYLLIPAAERYGQMASIDCWVIDRAFREYASLSRFGKLKLSINLSGTSISSGELPGYIASKFEEYEVPPDSICFELTETTAVRNVSQVLELMQTFKQRGCQFALDDFGSGLSSFRYLKQFPFDFLKIDGSLVQDVTADSTDAVMVKAIGQLSEALGLKCIAEWISEQEVARVVASLGIDYGQGYFYGRPVPIEDIRLTVQRTPPRPIRFAG